MKVETQIQNKRIPSDTLAEFEKFKEWHFDLKNSLDTLNNVYKYFLIFIFKTNKNEHRI